MLQCSTICSDTKLIALYPDSIMIQREIERERQQRQQCASGQKWLQKLKKKI